MNILNIVAVGINYEVTRVKGPLLINGIKRYGRMSDHVTATVWFVAWLLLFVYSCML
jgi:hypothetical protein